MKKLLNLALVCVLALCATTFTACDKGGEEGGDPGGDQITLPDQSEKTQQAFADEETTGGGFTFVAKSPWTASVAEPPASRAGGNETDGGEPSTRADGVPWLRLLLNGQEVYSGGAGTIDMAIELDPNYTSADRSATITISSGGTNVSITVTQNGVTEEGDVPAGPPSEKREIAFDGQIIPVVRTEFEEGAANAAAGGTAATYRHTMRFYIGENNYLQLLFVTGQRTLAGGTYTSAADPSGPASGNVEGTMNFTSPTGISDYLRSGSTVTVEKRTDGAYAVRFTGTSTVADKAVGLQFTGTLIRKTSAFVPVRNIAFPAAHALSTGEAELNSVSYLREAIVSPNTATNRQISWEATNATLNDDGTNTNGVTVTFDKAGTATVTATIGEGTLDANGNRVEYKKTWIVTVAEGSGATSNALTVGGQAYPVTKTEFSPAREWFGDNPGDIRWLHSMKFYADDTRYLELSFVTDRETFAGGAFTFGDIQMNNLNKAAGSLYYTNPDGTAAAESIEWGPAVRAVRADDNTLTVTFGKVTTRNTRKELSFNFTGPFENTSNPGGFVPVQSIDFPATHVFNTGRTALNTTCSLSEAIIQPNTATSQDIQWTVNNALLNGNMLTFNQAGEATVTATILKAVVNADGTTGNYTQSWTVTVGGGGDDAGGNIVVDGQPNAISKVEHTPSSYTFSDGTVAKSHLLKFWLNSNQYLQLQFLTGTDELINGSFNLVPPSAAVLKMVTGQVNFLTDDGDVRDIIRCNTLVKIERTPDNRLLVDLQGAYTETGNVINLHYEGAYENGGNTDPGDPTDPDPDKMITANGTQHPIVRAEHKLENWTSADGGTVNVKTHLLKFYINSARYAQVRIISNTDELPAGNAYRIGSAVGNAEVQFNFTTADGNTDYAAAGANSYVRVVHNADGTYRVQFAGIITEGNVPVGLLYEGTLNDTGEPSDPGFVPVQDITFPQGHLLNTPRFWRLELGSACSLSEAIVSPAGAVSTDIEWTVTNNATYIEDENRIIFDREGTAQFTATIRNAAVNTDGSTGDFIRNFSYPVYRVDPEKLVTVGSRNLLINSTTYELGQYVDGTCYHKIKFHTDGPNGVSIEFHTAGETLVAGEYASAGGGPASVGQALVFLDNITDGDLDYDYLSAGHKVTVERNNDGTFRIAITGGTTQYTGQPIGMQYVGELELEN